MFKQSRPCVGYLCAPIISVREAADCHILSLPEGVIPCRAASPHWPGSAALRHTLRVQKNLESPLPWRTMAALLNRPARFNARVVGKGACRDDIPHTPSLTGDGAP
jgi:hypothetical protein